MPYLIVSLFFITVAGCNAVDALEVFDGPDVEFSTDRTTYAPGGEIELRLRNESLREIGYNLCLSQIERLTGQTWQPATVRSEGVCTMELRGLRPNMRATYRIRLAPDAPAGTYRITDTIELMNTGTRRTITTNRFTIGR